MRFFSFFLVLFFLCGGCHAQIRVLEPLRDLNQAANLTAAHLIEWQSPFEPSLIGYDAPKRRLLRYTVDFPAFVGFREVLMENLDPPSAILSARIDDHPGEDLLVLVGESALVWSSGKRGVPGAGPDLVFNVGGGMPRGCGAVVADFDQDGFDDLLVGTGHPSAAAGPARRVVFSVGRPEAEMVEMPWPALAEVRVVRPWTAGGPAGISVRIGFGQGIDVFQFGPGRTLQRIDQIILDEPGWGQAQLVELDGIAPPEVLHAVDGELRVVQRVGAEWQVVTRIQSLAQPEHARMLVADFDGDGREEAMLAYSDLYFGEARLYLVSTAAEAGQVAARELPLPSGPSFWQALRLPGTPRSLLAGFQGDPTVSGPFGNPTSLPAAGTRMFIRNHPLRTSNYQQWEVRTHPRPAVVAAARLDDDAHQDLVMLDADYRLHTSLGGRADGLFSRASVQGLQAPLDLLMIDLDGDGLDDPVVSGWTNLQTFRTSTGASGVSFSKVADLSLGSGASSRAVGLLGAGDFNGDGNPDLLVLRGQDGMLCWVETSGGGVLGEVHPIALAGRLNIPFSGEQLAGRQQTLVLDADQDGAPDILTMPSALGNRLALHRNTPGGFVVEPLSPPLPMVPFPGGLPLVLSGSFLTMPGVQVVVLQPTLGLEGAVSTVSFVPLGAGAVALAGGGTIPMPRAAVVADFDQDGIDDLMTVTGYGMDIFGNPAGEPSVWFHRSRGDGTLHPPLPLATLPHIPDSLLVRDLDDDGLPDVLAASSSSGFVSVSRQQVIPRYPRFAEWVALHGLADTSPDADPDADGASNFLEYARGSHPGESGHATSLAPPAPVPPEMVTGGPYNMEFYQHPRPRAEPGEELRIHVEVSEDLFHWTPLELPLEISIDPRFPEWEIMRWRRNGLLVEEPPSESFVRFRIKGPAEDSGR